MKMVPRGLEPRTLRLLAVRSNQLSYETTDKEENNAILIENNSKSPPAAKKALGTQTSASL